MKKPILFLLISAFVLPIHTLGLAGESDAAAKLRIRQNVPNLLVPAGSIVRIDLKLTDGMSEKRGTIKDSNTLLSICSELREAILQDRFNVGRQIHSPRHTLEITIIHKEKPPIRLIWVGESMYWMFWNEETTEKHDVINFQSEWFDRMFFTSAFLELFQRAN